MTEEEAQQVEMDKAMAFSAGWIAAKEDASPMTDTPEQTRKCSNCMWWAYQAETWGVCRGAPPQVSLANDIYQALWPETDAFDWCGSFRMKEPGQ